MSLDHMGRSGFIRRHGLWNDAQTDTAAGVAQRVRENDIQAVRLSFADQHGVLRGKTVVASSLPSVLRNGCTITSMLLLNDTAQRTVYPVWKPGAGLGTDALSGAADMVLVPDPDTFRVLPWAADTGWMLCDIYFQDGTAVPFSSRERCRAEMAALASGGHDYLSGLEMEFHLFRAPDRPITAVEASQPGALPPLELLGPGGRCLTEQRLDELDPVLATLRDNLLRLGLPLRTLEVGPGPSQVELTFEPQGGLETADTAVLARSAIRQVCRRNGLLASFMSRPQGENLFSSGWHLHQSLWRRADGANAFMPAADAAEDGPPLAASGRHAVAGLLAHAAACCAFTTPTLNGYKRYRPHSLAPDRVTWSRDSRAAMLRVIGGPGDPGTRIENRVGEPAANPYLYLASQVASMRCGLAAAAEPPAPAQAPYDEPAAALPASLPDALHALDASSTLRGALGDAFVDYYLTLKRAEVARFLATVTDWEQREYLDLF